MSPPPPNASLLPPALALSPTQMADRAVVREAERGERLVATARVALTTSALILLGVNEGLPVLLGRGTVHGQGWIPVLLLPTALMGWIWLAILRRVPYRPAISRISAASDVFFVVLFMFAEVLIRRSPAAEGVALGALPPLLALMFMLAASGVRQDPWACLITGVMGAFGVGGVVVLAHHVVPLTYLPRGVASYGSVGPWIGRLLLFGFSAGTVALAARNARRMARSTGLAIAEQDKIKSLFGRYVDPGIARDVIEREGRAAQILEVTVLFTDLRDFTAMSESMEPQDVLEALNEHYEAIVPVVHEHGGTVNKFIGDAIMATFGAPLRHADHAVRAIAAAQGMLDAMDTLNERRARLGRPAMRMGVGIATGPVVVGTLGTSDRVEYAVIGDTVNTASRLEGLCKQFGTQLVISESTRDAVGDAMNVVPLGEAHVKGKASALALFTIETRRDRRAAAH